jgi:L-2,4-diaminobutyric acid acetyltransferase
MTTDRPAVQLRTADEDDVPRVMDLVSGSPYVQCHTEHTYWIMLRYGARYTFVAEAGDELVGYASGVRSTVDPELFFIWQVVVAPEYRRDSLALRLLRMMTDLAADDGCRVFHTAISSDNHPTIGLLDKWTRSTGRTWTVGEKISYQAEHGADGEPEDVVENVMVVRDVPGAQERPA